MMKKKWISLLFAGLLSATATSGFICANAEEPLIKEQTHGYLRADDLGED